MSQFTPLVSYETEFEGDRITMNLRRLQRKDMQKLTPYMHAEDGGTKITFSDQMEFSNMAMDLLPVYVSNFQGLTNSAGEPMSIESIIDEVYFSSLLQELVVEIFSISRLSGEDAKNSEAPSPEDSKVSPTTGT